jgi:RNA polymerase sigma-70 factor, ECF subfamily
MFLSALPYLVRFLKEELVAPTKETEELSDMQMDDPLLVKRILSGERELFRIIVERYERRLIIYVTQMLGNHELACDVTQETFLAAYRALAQWTSPKSATLGPWLYRIATNQAINHLRNRGFHQDIPFESVPIASSTDLREPFDEQIHTRELLTKALKQLTEEDIACLILHFVLGERYAEIAERLGLTSEAVRKRISRGLVTLRAAYQALDQEVLS